MGGTLAVTIRDPEGKEFRMLRWTNPTPYFVNAMGLVTKSPLYLSNYLQQWLEMKEDWERHEGKEPFDFPMTKCYSPYPAPLAPCGYGLLVIDMLKDRILHMQGYTSYGCLDIVGAGNDIVQDGDKSFWQAKDDDPNHACSLREFFEAGRIKQIYTRNPKADVSKLKRIEEIHDSKELLRYLKANRYTEKARNNPNSWACFDLDMSPFTVQRFDESPEGCEQLKAAVLECGFVLSPEEEQDWAEYIKRWDE